MIKQSLQQERNFIVGAYPVLAIHNLAGTITVRAGREGVIEIRASIEYNDYTEPPTIDMQCPDEKHVTIKVIKQPHTFLDGALVHFDVVVPRTIDADLHTHAGQIRVSGIHGQIALHSNAGTIEASNTMLAGDASFQTNAGTITFEGAIDPRARYQFRNNAGTIELRLPTSGAYHIDASTDLGNVESDFALASSRRNFVGQTVHGDIGTEPRARLLLSSNAGTIAIRKQ